MGMEDYEVRCWIAWYRHLTLVMIVMAALAGICAAARTSTAEPLSHEGTCPLLPLTIPEVRHLLAHLLWPPPRSQPLLLGWSWWRRCASVPCQLFSYEASLCRRVRSDYQKLSVAVLRSWDFSREKSQDHVISFLSFAERSFSHDQSFPC
jgi:hypothetical protein